MDNVISGKTAKLHKSIVKKILILTVASLGLAFSVNYFIIPIGIFSSGLGGICQGLSYTLEIVFNKENSDSFSITVYWLFYLLINIPIIIFTYFYYGKRLLMYSLYTLFLALAFSMFFAYTPGFKTASFLDSPDSLNTNTIAIMSFIGGIIYGLSIGLIFYQGSTSLGLDPLTRYLGREKGMNFGTILFTFSIINSLFWITILTIIDSSTSDLNFIDDVLFSAEILGSFVFITTFSFVANKIYPSSKKYLVEINSKKADAISTKLIEINYHRGHSIEEVIGGYSKEKRGIVKIVINWEEFYDILRIVNDIDSQAFIYATEAKGTHSNHYWNPVTMEDLEVKKNKEKRKNKKK